jgi:hypothetical protein
MIRCTAKLLKEVGIVADTLEGCFTDYEMQPLGDWYANLFWWEKRKCVIFTSSTTYLTFVVFDVFRGELRYLKNFFLKHLNQFLIHQRISSPIRERIISAHEVLPIGKTNSRTLLSVMSDLTNQAKYLADCQHYENEPIDYQEISCKLSDMPIANNTLVYPWKIARVALGLESEEEALEPVSTISSLARRVGSPKLLVIQGAKSI